ncbi:hypothetical protein CAL7716_023930 [Calothrix sp. PCC 7716]|nr:hypothetical protein CAL7716_023930 [Calothrix sp. PCC 7716]
MSGGAKTWHFLPVSTYFNNVKMKPIQPEVIKPWAVFILDSKGSRTRIASFSTRSDGETYLFKIRRQLPKASDPVLAFDR